MAGTVYGVGVGPGDPELITVRGARLIREADVVAYHSGTQGRSIARSIVADLIQPGVLEELLAYPVTVGDTQHPLGYYGAIAEFYDASAARLAAHLDAGRTVVVLAEGDPLFYSSYMYLHDRLSTRFASEIVPGVTSVSAATAAVATPLTRHEDVLTVLPGTLPVPELARRLADTDAAAIMKLGRTFAGVREALEQAGRLADAIYVERASTGRETSRPVAEVDPATVPYFSMIIVPGRDRRADSAQRAGESPASILATGAGELLVVGLGPGPDRWTTPEVSAALAGVDHVVGYAPYVERVPQRVGLRRHASGNTVEVDRARQALELALAGERVAVVSGGDAGVFGMAAAVFEAAENERYAEVAVTVLPGLTAAQAVAARAGAPLGGDFAVMSLSDRLKPWATIESRLRAVGTADLVVAVYNPASRSRTTQLKLAKEVLLESRDAGTPVVIGRDVGRPGEELIITNLGDLDPDVVDMKCLLIIGSSQTKVSNTGLVWTARSVPHTGAGEAGQNYRR
ncbi:MAG: Precorrin-2 C(20)-methyltransferase / Precorrin-3B C(17)-methyltransferase [uncultured Propionibacteriaceae bacterium]|uniref:Precorrin-2 C(20)-methyltransferase / Precorrin-3B C(17)-methyltransferase n=1 Tax=uncultured Propionibacteriaceae bacterium TaxID=257457 RepID=A0A6J4P6F6_9ACTN|nr:MAG: Precorrin-2 C(20)-methyltransferase / Precorrin-3B C(17)-methyltransferase [uncultured Propionibacteriaceae bacterium]